MFTRYGMNEERNSEAKRSWVSPVSLASGSRKSTRGVCGIALVFDHGTLTELKRFLYPSISLYSPQFTFQSTWIKVNRAYALFLISNPFRICMIGTVVVECSHYFLQTN
jgi:hypothetical protein